MTGERAVSKIIEYRGFTFVFNLTKLLKELGAIMVVEDRTVEVWPTCVRTGEHIFSILNHHVTGAIKKIQFYGLDCP